ncbi:hypothetical protein AMS68_002736 [Peltaster fructicola]|uniref:Amino acid transporter transmembrane domain-containing protein n=1 Tax=Peltaster fructicola TaxID=286661 RepID=A0A6H0XRG4_9PEZI|nr:hypothetical protein AMS68_002736 [Peltaster fructicola]
MDTKVAAPAHAGSYYIRPQQRRLHDRAVQFEEYFHYAEKTRAEQDSLPAPKTNWASTLLRGSVEDDNQIDHTDDAPGAPFTEKEDERRPSHAQVNLSNRANRIEITDKEWTDASRALRTASAGACFYLITTDILGPYGVGFAMGTLGWGPGIVLYTVFGGLAGYSGYLLYHCFLGLDSYEFPVKNYGDLAFRLFGTIPRQLVNILQALALILILGQVTIQNGQALSQVSQFKLCYVVCPIIFVVLGFFIGQIRTLRNYGLIANLAIWLNLLVIFISMGVMAHSPPNYAISVLGSAGGAVNPDTITPDADGNYPDVIHYNGLPDSGNFVGAINGLMSGVLAYSGAQLFVEFMAEMRRPRDFLKAMWGAQLFIWAVYMIYGCFVYYYQGQYSFSVSYQGVSPYGWQTACNMLGFISGLIAAGLYGNIGIKVLYNNVLMDIFNAPPLTSTVGKILWVIIVPLWWIIAFIIAAAIPDYFGFVSVIAASTLLQFTYSFPPMLALGYDIRRNAMRVSGGGFDAATGQINRNLHGLRYWVNGFFTGGIFQIGINVWHVIYALGSLVLAGLGMYAAIEAMIEAFTETQLNSFSCVSPLDLSG